MNEEKLKELKKLDVLCCNNGSIILGIVTTEKNDSHVISNPCYLIIKDNKEYLRPFFSKPKTAIVSKDHVTIHYDCEDTKLIQIYIEMFLEQKIVIPNSGLIN